MARADLKTDPLCPDELTVWEGSVMSIPGWRPYFFRERQASPGEETVTVIDPLFARL